MSSSWAGGSAAELFAQVERLRAANVGLREVIDGQAVQLAAQAAQLEAQAVQLAA